MLSSQNIDDLIHMRRPEAETRRVLETLVPEAVSLDCFQAFLYAMRQTAVPIPALSGEILDCCGTGGSGQPHFNTSTTVAFVLAATGAQVVKFGNRAMSSASGSFDFLEALGIPAELPLARLPELLDETGLIFLFAPQCLPALGRFNALRRSLGVRTIFNFMGPLLNPVSPAYRLLGVSHAGMQDMMATVLAQMPETRRAWVVRGGDTLDELTDHGINTLYQVEAGHVSRTTLEAPFDGLPDRSPVPAMPLTPADNAAIFHDLLARGRVESPYHRMVCLNAGAALCAAGRVPDIETGVGVAKTLLADGAVQATYERCRRLYARLAA